MTKARRQELGIVAAVALFVAGGWALIVHETGIHQLPASRVYFNASAICPDNFQKTLDYRDQIIASTSITLTTGCFGPAVQLPRAWHNWFYQPQHNDANWWVAFWVIGEANPRGPFGPNETADFNSGRGFRMQGHGEILIYSNDVAPGAGASESSPDVTRITHLSFQNADPHLCNKPDDAYFENYGPAEPRPAGSGEFHNPDFQFDLKHGDNKVSWASAFTGKLVVCLLIDEKGIPTKISFPQSPGQDMEAKVTDYLSGWRFKPGWYTTSYLDHSPKYVSTQAATEITFK